MRRPTPLLLAAVLGLFAAAPRSTAADPALVITGFPALWHAAGPAEAEASHPVRMEVVVLYHDALWKGMWARCGDITGYLGFTEVLPQTKPGQRVLIEGSYHTGTTSLLDQVRFTLIGEPVPLEPLDARGRMDRAESLHASFLTLEGLVDRQTDKDPAHLTLDVVADGRLVTVWLPHPVDTPVPVLEQAIIRATGLFCATPNPAGQYTRLELCTNSPEQVAVVGWLDRDDRFAAPPTPIQDLPGLPGDKLVHINGIARAVQPGRNVTIRDHSGQITVLSPQTTSIQVGDQIETIGFPRTGGADWRLEQGLFRRSQQQTATLRGLPRLRLAAQLRELSPSDADRGYPVQLTGVVTWSHPDSPFFFVLDGTGGACVRKPEDRTPAPPVGNKVEVVGVSESGTFAPVVRASGVHSAGVMDLPEGHPVTLEQALTGVEEAQWVTMSGYVRDITTAGPWSRLEVGTSAGTFSAMLPDNAPLVGLRGAVVRLRGVCSAIANEKRQLDAVRLWVPDASSLAVEERAPADPFSVPAHTIASLRQFGSLLAFNRRVRISGVVVGQLPGRVLHVQDGADGLLVLSRDVEPLVPGDRVEVVGFPCRESIRVVLHEGTYRKIDSGAEPPPLALAGLRPVDPEADGRLVEVEGTLLDVSPQERGTRLTLQNDTGIFEALIDRPKPDLPGAWAPGSRVALTGVYEVNLDEYKRPSSARVLLRRPADVRILARPDWWTVRRALGVSGVLAFVTVGGFAWVVALRRRVHRQTELIREQYEKEKAARNEATLVRTSKLESLGLLAGGIAHDFNNLLNVVICNLSLLRLDRKFDRDTEQCIADSTRASLRARDLTLQLLTFAKGGEPVRAAVALPEVVRESGEFARHGSKVSCLYDFADDLWPAQVDRGQIGQVVHNLVLNAAQAMPNGGVVIVALRNTHLDAHTVADLPAGRYVQLTIADQGTGIPADLIPRIFDPYFTTKQTGNGLGLATVYSIVRRHQGQIEVASALGNGTTFTIWLPAAETAPTAPNVDPLGVRPQVSGRILFMDDEEQIRRTAALLFRRLGLEFQTVADGAAAVREYLAARDSGRPFDAVILDLTVPGGMGGAEAMAQLRAVDPRVCGIVSSGYSGDPVLANHRDFGFAAMIRKPYEARDVAHVLAQVLPPATSRQVSAGPEPAVPPPDTGAGSAR